MNTKDMIEVMQAFEDGKKIEFRERGSRTWKPDENPEWDWSCIEYRIAPEPKKAGRWERKNIRIFYGEYVVIWENHDSGDELIHLNRMISTPGFGGIDYRSPFDPKVIVRSTVPVMFREHHGEHIVISHLTESCRPGIPVVAWFWREGEEQ